MVEVVQRNGLRRRGGLRDALDAERRRGACRCSRRLCWRRHRLTILIGYRVFFRKPGIYPDSGCLGLVWINARCVHEGNKKFRLRGVYVEP